METSTPCFYSAIDIAIHIIFVCACQSVHACVCECVHVCVIIGIVLSLVASSGVGPSSRSPGVVNATAPSPNVRLRITDRNGADVAGARLGDELFLRIEMDDDSEFSAILRPLSHLFTKNQGTRETA